MQREPRVTGPLRRPRAAQGVLEQFPQCLCFLQRVDIRAQAGVCVVAHLRRPIGQEHDEAREHDRHHDFEQGEAGRAGHSGRPHALAPFPDRDATILTATQGNDLREAIMIHIRERDGVHAR